MTCEEELHGSVTRMASSILSLIGINTKAGGQGPYDVKKVPSSFNCLPEKLSDLAPDKRRARHASQSRRLGL